MSQLFEVSVRYIHCGSVFVRADSSEEAYSIVRDAASNMNISDYVQELVDVRDASPDWMPVGENSVYEVDDEDDIDVDIMEE